MEDSIQRAVQMAALDGRFRRTFAGGDVVFTDGVRALGDRHLLITLMQAVACAAPLSCWTSFREA